MFNIDPSMDMVQALGMSFMLIILSVVLFNLLKILLGIVSLVFLKLTQRKYRYTVLHGKNEFCRSINCEALGYFGCSIPGCRHTVKDLKRWLKQNKYIIITEEE